LDGKNGENIRYPERVSFLLKHHDEHQNALKSGFTWRPEIRNQRESKESMLFSKEELIKIKNLLKGR